MSKVQKIISDIECLTTDEKKYVYKKLKNELLKEVDILNMLNKYRGIANNVWKVDAQEYISDLRKDDRI